MSGIVTGEGKLNVSANVRLLGILPPTLHIPFVFSVFAVVAAARRDAECGILIFTSETRRNARAIDPPVPPPPSEGCIAYSASGVHDRVLRWLGVNSALARRNPLFLSVSPDGVGMSLTLCAPLRVSYDTGNVHSLAHIGASSTSELLNKKFFIAHARFERALCWARDNIRNKRMVIRRNELSR